MAQKTGQNAIKYSIITAFSKKGLDAAEKGLKKLLLIWSEIATFKAATSNHFQVVLPHL